MEGRAVQPPTQLHCRCHFFFPNLPNPVEKNKFDKFAFGGDEAFRPAMRWPALLLSLARFSCKEQLHKQFYVPFGETPGPGPPLLGPDTFYDFVRNAPLALVMFGTSWCPWTQALDPIFSDAWDMVQEGPFADEVRLGKVDCNATDSELLCEKQNITACT